MSFEEPKAPIVRIRKKKTKKKSKENDVVHLPVRASRQTRYSSLVPPANPQHKGRECCRHMFSACFKIPVCKVVCFRCILPKCYSGNGSDDEENDPEGRDEGYHSQNRRSSEVTPVPISVGAQGGTSDPQDVEMTEMKTTETVVLIPPPRVSVKSNNDYRKDPCSSDQDQLEGATGDITYIEVESVSLHREGSPPEDDSDTLIIPKYEPSNNEGKSIPGKIGSLKITDKELTHTKETDTDYEIPIHLRFLETERSSVVRPKIESGPTLVAKVNKKIVDLVDCDKNDSSETEHYVNEDVIMANQSQVVLSSVVKQEDSDSSSINYANIAETCSDVQVQARPHSNTPNNGETGIDEDIDDEKHDYLNLSALQPISETKKVEHKEKHKPYKVEGMVNTKSEDIIKLRKNLFSKSARKRGEYTESKREVTRGLSLDSVVKTNKVIEEQRNNIRSLSDSLKLVEDVDDDKTTEAVVPEKVLLPMRISVKERKVKGSSSEGEVDDILQDIVNDETTTDQTKLI